MSTWSAVLEDVAARGGTPAQVAARLGLPAPLVHTVLDQAERLGLVAVAGRGCGSGCPTGPAMPASCAGCPLAGATRATAGARPVRRSAATPTG